MVQLPTDIDSAIIQAQRATQTALAAGNRRLQIELNIPELKIMPIAERFLPMFENLQLKLRVFFPDAGSAALARRDWGHKPYEIRGMEELKAMIHPDDQLFLFIEPSAVEVETVEKLCDQAGDRPVVLLNPRLEDIATIGIGYAGRQLRERFLSTFICSYYLRPLEKAAILRAYPDPWQVWVETDFNAYELMTEQVNKPMGDELDRILSGTPTPDQLGTPSSIPPWKAKKNGFLSELQTLFRALTH
ncbi:MAG: DUF1995 family protein [Cyanobacteria bacterium WB6_1B_304]|jgi:hypothetical protein|nr:DUF1995 family protein [Cyanobacteria bacterium WB6_1B_304]